MEIGHNREVLEAEFPELPFTWPELDAGSNLVLLIQREDLPA
jgi:ribosomal protein L3 glutamine methyltransferase